MGFFSRLSHSFKKLWAAGNMSHECGVRYGIYFLVCLLVRPMSNGDIPIEECSILLSKLSKRYEISLADKKRSILNTAAIAA